MQSGFHDPVGAGSLEGRPALLFDGFLEAAPDAVVVVDGNGAITQVNRQAEALFGYRRQELCGRPLEILMPERYRRSHVARARAYATDPRPRPMGSGLDLFGLRKDGSEFPIDVSISPLRHGGGQLLASTIRDMSSHRRLEEQLRQRACALEQADRQKDDFLCVVAHELRSPLTVLTLAAQMLRLPQDAEVHERTLGRLEHQIAHMTRLIEDLLDMGRVRSGAFTLCRQAVDLRTVLAGAMELAQPLVESRGHRLEVAPMAGPLWVDGDPTRLVQVVSNLITNAATYTGKGGCIRLSAGREEGGMTIRVRDDGVGIPAEMLSRVFELFTQVAPSGDRRMEGLGIGLALVRRLVELHGGTVEASSGGVGEGSEFIVRLPPLPGHLETGPLATDPAAVQGS